MKKIIIFFNGKEKEIIGGLRKVDGFYRELSLDPSIYRLYLDKTDDIDIPLLPDDYIIFHGEERIVADDINEETGLNLPLKKPICFKFNGTKIEEGFKQARVIGQDIQCLDKELTSTLLFADLEDLVDAPIQNDLSLVVQDRDAYITIPSNDVNDGTIDLEECAKKDRKPPKGQNCYRIKIDGEKYDVKNEKMKGAEILGLAGKNYDEWSLNQKFSEGRRVPIKPDDFVNFSEKGIERFETIKKQAQQGLPW